MQHLLGIQKTLVSLLNKMGVEYLLVGGFAVRYYGYLRETRDLDLWVPYDDPENAAKIIEVLREFCGEIPEETLTALLQPNRIIEVIVPPVQIDVKDPIVGQRPAIISSFTGNEAVSIEFLTVQSGSNFHEAYAARTLGVIDGIQVSIASLDHVRAIKQAGGRLKDRLDLDHLG